MEIFETLWGHPNGVNFFFEMTIPNMLDWAGRLLKEAKLKSLN
jgi:hypothetical protein